MIEYVEDDIDELTDSNFSKDAARVLDEIDNGKAGVFLSSKSFDLIETLGNCFRGEDMVGQLHKVDPN